MNVFIKIMFNHAAPFGHLIFDNIHVICALLTDINIKVVFLQNYLKFLETLGENKIDAYRNMKKFI